MKTASVALILLVLVAMANFFSHNNGNPTPISSDISDTLAPKPPQANEHASNTEEVSLKYIGATAQDSQEKKSPSEEQLLWLSQRGFDTEAWRPYYSLTEAELEELAITQDTNALIQLASTNISKDPMKAIAYYELAATLGSLVATNGLSSMWAGYKNPPEEMWGSTTSRNRGANALAYVYVGIMRGDNVSTKHTFRQLDKQFSFTPADMQLACELAQTNYEKLSANRTAMGLSNFDNAPSPEGIDSEELYTILTPCVTR